MKASLILLLGLIVATHEAHAGQIHTGSIELQGTITSNDSVGIPDPGYPFAIKIGFSLSSDSPTGDGIRTITSYDITAKAPAAAPAFSYLGKTLLLISNWAGEFCKSQYGSSDYYLNSRNLNLKDNGRGQFEMSFVLDCIHN